MNSPASRSANSPLLDRGDERVQHVTTLSGSARAFVDRVRSGDLGSLPVVVGLIVIWTIFQSLNPIFLSSNNLVNMLYDAATIGVISLGIVCILMVGEIDLSVGSVSGFSSALVGVLWVNHGWPAELAIVAAIASGAAIGLLYAFLFLRFGMPSFVSTLAGLLAVLGLQLFVLGPTGSINLPYGSPLVNLGQSLFMPHWLAYGVATVAGVSMWTMAQRTARRRQAAGLSADSNRALFMRAAALTAGLDLAVFYVNQDRGVPWMFATFVGLVTLLSYALTRTQWGRAVTAVGATARRRGAPVCRWRASTPALSCCARCWPPSAACSPRHAWPPPASRRAPAT